MMETRPKC